MDLADLWPAPDYLARWERLLTLLDPRPGERILDVGFGHGQALRAIGELVGPLGVAAGVEQSVRLVAGLQAVAPVVRAEIARKSADPVAAPAPVS